MKYLFLFCIIVTCPAIGFCQVVNPTIISQDTDIALHNKIDVYYKPFAPPDSTDTREGLCNIGIQLADPNGVGNNAYWPKTHGVYLYQWCPWPDSTQPHGDTLGVTAIWQRLFTAKCKPSGAKSDIIAGGGVHDTVTVSKNEDVDFRATGTIKLKNGFHVKPGAFFHAYIAPKWGDSVFSDEFDGPTLDRSKWIVMPGVGDANGGADCSSDSDVKDTLDPDAHDGHALDIDLRELPPGDTCFCQDLTFNAADDCLGKIADDTIRAFRFATATLRSCPWPDSAAAPPFKKVYQHGPYGKYEIREKIPHIRHHTNNWGWYDWEWDMGETFNWQNMTMRNPGFVLNIRHGPFKGKFGKVVIHPGDTETVFRSSDAQFSLVNKATKIFINNFSYLIFDTFTATDTFLRPFGTTPSFPSSLASDTIHWFTFDYERLPNDTTDNFTWTVDTDSHGTKRIFSAAYHDSSGTLQHFTKDYQPTSITLTYDLLGHQKTLSCQWEQSLNKIMLIDTLLPSDLDSNTERYSYVINEGYVCPFAPVAFDGDDTTGGYVYHTYTMELLPHEMRYLIDGNVIRRFPDRLVPTNNKYYDPISKIMRNPTYLNPAEFEIDRTTGDPFGTDADTTDQHDGLIHYNSATYMERTYFEAHDSSYAGHPANPGMWDVTIGGHTYHAAHHLIDYVKIWDVPADVKIPNFPQ